jgi:hypothetical protein
MKLSGKSLTGLISTTALHEVRTKLRHEAAIATVTVLALVGLMVAPAVNAAPNTIVNPSLEQTANGLPNCFSQNGWGDHTATWALTAGHTGTVAQSITIANYVSGDRKLMMAENTACAPAVTAGNTYDLSVWYKSTSANNSLTVFRHSSAGWAYWKDLAACRLPPIGHKLPKQRQLSRPEPTNLHLASHYPATALW